ncbi:MAG: hypothetical protein J6M19_06450 [Bacteroidaceae bacterium]|nr:hypothetical protein [Bacteroidaceae bacterium]
MIVLSEERINANSPYQVVPIKYGFSFQTDRGIHYAITFREDQPIGNCDTYQFIIDKVDREPSSHDAKVEHTIMAILDEFFVGNLDVLLYMCDTGDNRQAARNRLFLTWFKNHADSERFTIKTADTVVEDMPIYVAIIVENRNPKLSAITEDFDQTAEALKKPQ